MSQPSSTSEIGASWVDGVLTIELRRPAKRNAMTAAMWRALLAELDTATNRSDLQVVVLRGAGGFFCAGADLAEVMSPDGSPDPGYRELALRGIAAIAALPVPTVAAVEGACFGAGCSMALACDLRFAHSDATFCIPAARHGVPYDEASIARLVALTGPGFAAGMLHASWRVDGATALERGLVEACTPDLTGAVTDLVDAVRAADAPTVRATRATLRALS